VSLETKVPLSDRAWAKIVGVYIDKAEEAQIDPNSRTAGFFSIVPGKYLALLLDGEKLLCTKQIIFRREHAHLTLSLSADGCTAKGDSLAEPVE
jgi:hypothetical protein